MKKDCGFADSLNVLIVDDDEELRFVFRLWLAGEKIDVTEAHDVEEAWALLTTPGILPMVLIADNQTHGKTGIEFLSRVQQANAPVLGVILVSGDPAIMGEGAFLKKEFARVGVPFFILVKDRLFHEEILDCLAKIKVGSRSCHRNRLSRPLEGE